MNAIQRLILEFMGYKPSEHEDTKKVENKLTHRSWRGYEDWWLNPKGELTPPVTLPTFDILDEIVLVINHIRDSCLEVDTVQIILTSNDMWTVSFRRTNHKIIAKGKGKLPEVACKIAVVKMIEKLRE